MDNGPGVISHPRAIDGAQSNDCAHRSKTPVAPWARHLRSTHVVQLAPLSRPLGPSARPTLRDAKCNWQSERACAERCVYKRVCAAPPAGRLGPYWHDEHAGGRIFCRRKAVKSQRALFHDKMAGGGWRSSDAATESLMRGGGFRTEEHGWRISPTPISASATLGSCVSTRSRARQLRLRGVRAPNNATAGAARWSAWLPLRQRWHPARRVGARRFLVQQAGRHVLPQAIAVLGLGPNLLSCAVYRDRGGV